MAIIERKQLTGTTEQINAYAGHNGQLAFDKTTKHLHVLSGTAGTTTKLANVSDIPAPVDISGKADKTYVDTELAKKQTKGDYATNTALTQGLAGKANSSHTHTIANVTGLQDALNGKLATTAKIPYSQITGTPSIPDASNLIPRGGDGGTISVYETQHPLSSGGSIGLGSPSILVVNPGTPSRPVTIRINAGETDKGATKLLYIFNASSVTFTPITGVGLTWANDTAPTFKAHNIVVLTFHNSDNVFASLVSAWR